MSSVSWQQSVSDTLAMVGIGTASWQAIARAASGLQPSYADSGRYGIFGLTIEDASAVAPVDANKAQWLSDPLNSARALAARKQRMGVVSPSSETPDTIAQLGQQLGVGPSGINACSINPNDPSCRGAVQGIKSQAQQILGGSVVGNFTDTATSAPASLWAYIKSSFQEYGGRFAVGGLGMGLVLVGAVGLVFAVPAVGGAARGLVDGVTDAVPGAGVVKKTVRGARAAR